MDEDQFELLREELTALREEVGLLREQIDRLEHLAQFGPLHVPPTDWCPPQFDPSD